MNVRHDQTVDFEPVPEPGMAVPVDVFLEWVRTQDAKYEYDRGTIGMMVDNTQDHAALVSRLVFGLMLQLDRAVYQVVADGFGVAVADSVRYPDVLVHKPSSNGKSRRSASPLVIVEVISPSSFHLDMVVKRAEYLSLPTLQAYVVLSQNEPDLAVWQRAADGTFAVEPDEVTGLDAVLMLSGLGVRLPLAELYGGLS